MGLGDLFGGGTQTQTSTTMPIQPNYTPEQLYYMNLANQTAWANVLAGNPLAATTLNQMLGTSAPVTLPYGMSPEQMAELEDPYSNWVMRIGEMDKSDRDKFVNTVNSLSGPASSRRQTIEQLLKEREPVLGWFRDSGRADYRAIWRDIQDFSKKYNLSTDDIIQLYNQIGGKPDEFLAETMAYTKLPEETKANIQSYIAATPEEREAKIAEAKATTEQAASEWVQPKSELENYLESLTPEKLEGAIASQEQAGLQSAEDWYKRAQIEAQQRLLAQGGGYLGSTPENAFQTLDVGYGRNVADLKTQMQGLRSMLPAETSMQKLGVLSGLYGQGTGVQTQQTAQWLPVATGYYNVPWGQQTTQSTQIPSSGLIPTLSDIAGIGLGAYGMGNALGWWGGGSSLLSNPSNWMGGATGFGNIGYGTMPVW